MGSGLERGGTVIVISIVESLAQVLTHRNIFTTEEEAKLNKI